MTAVPHEVLDECLTLLAQALNESRNRRFEQAKKALAVALVHANEIPPQFLPDYRAAWMYATILTQTREAPDAITQEIRSKASRLLDEAGGCEAVELYQSLMFEALGELGELQRAIPFGERALAIAAKANDAIRCADLLWRIGGCYSRMGLRDHAAIAYRGAARVFRQEPHDPRFPVVLLALGNAIRKTEAAEAEALYREAAGWWEAKGQLESATPAWMNLGVLCSEQERYPEAIEYYERVRRVREARASTPPVRIGALYNNLAGCYRKMQRHAEAHQAIEHALRILAAPGALGPKDGSFYASSLGTKGMILRDEGRDAESVEWFRRARAEFESQPSPNFENVIEELENEAHALRRLGRTAEAEAVEATMARVREKAAKVPGLSATGAPEASLSEGAVLVEVDGGMRGKAKDPELEKLGYLISEILNEKNLGGWGGCLRGLETSTLCYYGPDAAAMYGAMEELLRGDPQCEGARIVLRQGTEMRHETLPHRHVN